MSYSSRLKSIQEKLDRRIWKRNSIRASLRADKERLQQLRKDLVASLEAKEIIHEVAKQTQEELEFLLSDLVSTALASIFPEPYKLSVSHESKRGKVDVQLDFIDSDGHLLDAMKGTGDGTQDITGMSLRFTCWAISSEGGTNTRPIIVMDQPLVGLKGGTLPDKGALMIKQISKEFGVQIIMVSHDMELIDHADNVIKVVKRKGVSQIL